VTITESTDLAPEWAWSKSSYSSGAEGNCLETAETALEAAPKVGVRDSKNKKGPAVAFERSSWTAFVSGVRAGHFGVRA
jgi:hypothetical protein